MAKQNEIEQQENVSRGIWSNKLQFVLSCVGMSVGLANVWRFPYLAYENGGGTFLLVYVIILLLVGIPLYIMEVARGQFSKSGPIAVWDTCPAFTGVGWAMIFIAAVGSCYYNVLLAYTVVYMASSFTSILPWTECHEWWGADDNCYVLADIASKNETFTNDTFNRETNQTASQQYWEKFVLNLEGSTGIDHLGGLQWRLILALAFTWSCCLLCVFKGIKSIGKAVYFTATFPYVILFTLLIRGVIMPGAGDGLAYFFTPQWSKMADVNVWMNATRQVVYSLGVANGTLITLASYNKFNNTCHKDSIIVSLLDCFTSLMASIVVFSVLGTLSKQLNVAIPDIFTGGQGLAFILFPDVVTLLPVPQLWCFMFFFMLFILGIDSTFTMFESIWTALMDRWPELRRHQTRNYILSTIVLFLFGLPFTTAGGQYLFNLIDVYNVMSRALLAAVEVIGVMWFYGVDRFCNDINAMLGFVPHITLKISWKFICPALILILSIMSFVNFRPPTYGTYEYPSLAHGIGALLPIITIGFIPLGFGRAVYKHWKLGNFKAAFNLPLNEHSINDEAKYPLRSTQSQL